MNMVKGFKFIDLFAGLGGFHLAASSLGGECVFASELNQHLRDVYAKNYSIYPAGDIRKISVDDIPPHDLLCAGFPCQPFSKAGSQDGLQDGDRGQVFFEVLRIIDAHSPALLIFENVANFVRHDSGNTYQRIREELESREYVVDYRQYSPHQFGIPQIRERIYLVASKTGLNGFNWPETPNPCKVNNLRNILTKNPKNYRPLGDSVVRCIDAWQNIIQSIPEDEPLPSFPIWAMEFGATYPLEYDSLNDCSISRLRKCRGAFGQSLAGLSREEIMQRLPRYATYSAASFPRWKRLFIQQNRNFFEKNSDAITPHLATIMEFPPSHQKLEWNCQGEIRDLWRYVLQFRASGLRVKRPTKAPSLVAMTTTQIPIIAWEKRYMTARECARLQSMQKLKYLPDGEAAFKALGNAVNVDVVRNVISPLLTLLPKRNRMTCVK